MQYVVITKISATNKQIPPRRMPSMLLITMKQTTPAPTNKQILIIIIVHITHPAKYGVINKKINPTPNGMPIATNHAIILFLRSSVISFGMCPSRYFLNQSSNYPFSITNITINAINPNVNSTIQGISLHYLLVIGPFISSA